MAIFKQCITEPAAIEVLVNPVEFQRLKEFFRARGRGTRVVPTVSKRELWVRLPQQTADILYVNVSSEGDHV